MDKTVRWGGMVLAWLVFAVAPGLAATAPGAAAPIAVEAKVDKPNATVGDIVVYSITAHHDRDVEIVPPDLGKDVDGFEPARNGTAKPRSREGKITEEYWFRLRADRVGSFAFKPIPVHFKMPDAREPGRKIDGQVLTPQVAAEVRSVLRLQGEPADIRDIKPLIPAGTDRARRFLYGLAVAALCLLGFLARKFVKKRPRETHIMDRPPTPGELALRELEALQARSPREPGALQELHFELSEIFRRYLGARYGFPALDWTAEEIGARLRQLPELDGPLRDQARDILDRADKVKFARVSVDREAFAATVLLALRFVRSAEETMQTIVSPANRG